MSTTTTPLQLKMGLATREAYGQALAELGAKNPNVIALDADLAKSRIKEIYVVLASRKLTAIKVSEARP